MESSDSEDKSETTQKKICVVYSSLVKDQHDLIGIIAYHLYKEQKKQFFEKANNSGMKISDEEISGFFKASCLPNQVEALRVQAEKIYNEIFHSKILELYEKYRTDFFEDETHLRIEILSKQLDTKTTTKGWFTDVAKILITNIMTVIVIGLILSGNKGLGELNRRVESMVGDAPNTEKSVVVIEADTTVKENP